jgi:hypothetical protein
MSTSFIPYLISGTFTLLGVMIGSGLQMLAQRRSAHEQTKRQKIDLRRCKLEELFDLTVMLERGLFSTWTNALGRLKFGVEQFPLETDDKVDIPIQKIEMIIGFYFPELDENFSRIKIIWKRAGKGVVCSIRPERASADHIAEARAVLSRSLEKLNAEIEDLTREMRKVAQDLMRD